MVGWCLEFVCPWSQKLQGFQHRINLDKTTVQTRGITFTSAVTLTVWDLERAEFLKEKEIWLLN